MKVNKGQEIVAFAKVLENIEQAKRVREKAPKKSEDKQIRLI